MPNDTAPRPAARPAPGSPSSAAPSPEAFWRPAGPALLASDGTAATDATARTAHAAAAGAATRPTELRFGDAVLDYTASLLSPEGEPPEGEPPDGAHTRPEFVAVEFDDGERLSLVLSRTLFDGRGPS